MTTIYNKYYESVSNGTINVYDNINFSAFVCDKSYIPTDSHDINDITGIIQTSINILTDKDIVTLSMSEIIDKIYNNLDEELQKKAYKFVVYDTATDILCFSEDFMKNMMEENNL